MNSFLICLPTHEWSAFERIRDVIGEAAVIRLLRLTSREDQKNTTVSCMHHEILKTRKQFAISVSSIKTVLLKLFRDSTLTCVQQ